MYKKSAQGWLKHWDFILMDVVCLQIAFIFGFVFRNGFRNPYMDAVYRNEAAVFVLCQIVVVFFGQSFQDVLKRGRYIELTKTVKHVCMVMLLSMAYLYITQQSLKFSRVTFFITLLLYLMIAYVSRMFWKSYLIKMGHEKIKKRSLVVLTVSDMAEEVLLHISSSPYQDFGVTGIALLDQDMTGKRIGGIPVVGNKDTIKDYICREWVDEVFLKLPEKMPFPQKLVDAMMIMGVTVHLSLGEVESISSNKQYVEKMGSYTVLTSSINMASPKQLLYKRFLDISGGIVGCLLTLLLIIIVGPMIYLKSPGPIFFSQTRIGKNGKKFKIYKFRSMYMDAEERKKELMEQNKMDGFMFKLDYDPRIIGSEKKDRNGNPKGIGNFIRKTSIDEFPQFWNVLKGDMSLVGTRPPTLDEWEQYDLHHRVRMSMKPGITGMWQVSGRSDITDFEEVVRMDTEYIENWSIGLDIKILIKTVVGVLKNEGAV